MNPPTVERAGVLSVTVSLRDHVEVLCKWTSVPWYYIYTFEKDSTNGSLSATNLYWHDSGGFIIAQYVRITVPEKEQLAPCCRRMRVHCIGSECLNKKWIWVLQSKILQGWTLKPKSWVVCFQLTRACEPKLSWLDFLFGIACLISDPIQYHPRSNEPIQHYVGILIVHNLRLVFNRYM